MKSIFSNQVVWITGASSGIGEAMAKDFVKRGAKVILTARREERLQKLAVSLGGPTVAKVLPADLATIQHLPELTRQAIDQFGHVDVLFNNAGFSQRSSVIETPFELERRCIEVDLVSPIALTKAILPHFLSRKSGRILVTSSLMGYLELPNNATYACVKHGLNGYFYSLGYELAKHSIPVQVIEPGFVKTEVTLAAMTASGQAYGKMDPTHAKSMTAEEFSTRVFPKIERGQTEIIVAGWERFALYIRWWFPCVYRFLIHRLARKILRDRFE